MLPLLNNAMDAGESREKKVNTKVTKTIPECFWEDMLCGWIALQSNSLSSLHKMGQTQISAVQVP